MQATKWSNFHVTCNFNKDDETHMPEFREAVDQMVESPYLWWWLKLFDNGAQENFDEDNAQLIEFVRVRASFEHDGKVNHGLHVHLLVEVGHSTMVQISKYGMCELFRHFVKLNPNCHIRFMEGYGEDKDFILRYLEKEVPTYKPQSQFNSRLKYAFAEGRNEQQEAANELPL
jgi:hypothetical protein